MSIAGKITAGVLAGEALLFLLSALAGNSFSLAAFCGAVGSMLVVLGAVAAPVAILFGFVRRRANIRNCGYVLLILNTLPAVVILLVGQMLFGDQYEDRGADGRLKNGHVEQGAAPLPPAPQTGPSEGAR